jgi:hypothetical protein
MTKTMLVMAITATLIFSILALENTVFAVEQGDKFQIKTKPSTFSCETAGEVVDSCGELKAQFRILVDNTDEPEFTGLSQIRIDIIDDGVRTKRYVLGNPSGVVPPAVVTFQNNVFTVEGKLVDKNGGKFDLMVIGDNIQQNKNKVTLDLDIKISNSVGVFFAENVQGLRPTTVIFG